MCQLVCQVIEGVELSSDKLFTLVTIKLRLLFWSGEKLLSRREHYVFRVSKICKGRKQKSSINHSWHYCISVCVCVPMWVYNYSVSVRSCFIHQQPWQTINVDVCK